MRIVVLIGSPNRHGSTHLLVESFRKGAEEAGHTVSVIDVAHADVHPCTGCITCGYEGPCVQKDDMDGIQKEILDSDMIVFATPLYYFGMTAQLKAVIDRFCSFNSSLHARHLKSALLAVAWNEDGWTFDALRVYYETLAKYCHFDDQGMILGAGCGMPSMTKHTRFIQDAYELGRHL